MPVGGEDGRLGDENQPLSASVLAVAKRDYELRAAVWSGGQVAPLIEDEQILAWRPGDGLIWVHVVANNVEAAATLLRNGFHFAELEVEDALSLAERPSVQESADHLFLVAPFVHPGGTDSFETYVEVAFFVEKERLTTVSLTDCPLLLEWFAKWQKSPERYGETTADLCHSLLDVGVDAFFPAVDALEEMVEDLEDDIYSGGRAVVRDALAVKRRLLEMRRRLAPLRDVLNALLRRDVVMIPNEIKPYFQNLYDHTIRISETLDLTRDILSSVLDAHLSIVSNNLNDVMRKMTVISTLLMTAALVAGIYGMNFKFMPELNWWLGYPLAVAIMVVASFFELWLFRRKGWL